MRRLVCLAVGVALACWGASAMAEEAAASKVGLEAHGLWAFNFNDDEDEGSNADDTFGGGASFVFGLHENIKLDIGADYYKPKSDDESDLKAQFIPVCAALRFGGNLESVFLYAGGGAGYSFNSLDVEGASSSDIDLDDCMVYFACGGAEFNLNEDLYLRGEFRYNWMKPELNVKIADEKFDVKFDHMQLRAGLGFNF